MRNIILIIVLTCFLCCKVIAQVPVEGSHHRPTGIAPKFFGPYAYPIPDLDEAKVSDKLTFQIAGDVNIGHIGGKGVEDYPFDQIRVGLKVSFDVLKYLKKDTNR